MTNSEGHGEGSLLALSLLALVAGALAGLVGAIFRLCLAQADRLRDVLIARAHGWQAAGFLLILAACASQWSTCGAPLMILSRPCSRRV
jgi:hypothetical protein